MSEGTEMFDGIDDYYLACARIEELTVALRAAENEVDRLAALHLERTKTTDRDLRALIAERDAAEKRAEEAERENERLREALETICDIGETRDVEVARAALAPAEPGE